MARIWAYAEIVEENQKKKCRGISWVEGFQPAQIHQDYGVYVNGFDRRKVSLRGAFVKLFQKGFESLMNLHTWERAFLTQEERMLYLQNQSKSRDKKLN